MTSTMACATERTKSGTEAIIFYEIFTPFGLAKTGFVIRIRLNNPKHHM